MTPTRRAVLAALGTTVATAGCFGTEPSGPDPSPTDTPTESTPTRTPDGPYAAVPCPSFTETDQTVCWHTRTGADPLVLEPETTELRPVEGNNTVETLVFTLRNRSDRPFGLNPYEWQLQVRDGEGWRRVAPDEYIEPWYTVQPGETYKWVLSTQQHPTPAGEDTVHVMEDLEDGTYAFAVHGFLDEGTDDPVGVECVALFDVTTADGTPTATDGTTPTQTDG